MVKLPAPISLRLSRARLARSQAAARIITVDRQRQLKRTMQSAAMRALLAARNAFDAEAELNSNLSDVAQKRQREMRQHIEAELRRMAGLGE
jgi:hypothetical protein